MCVKRLCRLIRTGFFKAPEISGINLAVEFARATASFRRLALKEKSRIGARGARRIADSGGQTRMSGETAVEMRVNSKKNEGLKKVNGEVTNHHG